MSEQLSTTVPATLQHCTQWICWREESRGGKPTKVPVDPESGAFASTTDEETWTDFETATTAIDVDGADGVIFVFSDEDNIVGIDPDDCRNSDAEEPQDWANDVIERLDSYTEVSPSGTGYHVLVEGTLPDGQNRNGDIGIYDSAGFTTVPGDRV